MFDKIKSFRDHTRELYLQEEQEKLSPWKKKVMQLHEESGFLFYYDSCELDTPDGSSLVIQGELAKDGFKKQATVYLYDGQARMLGKGILMSDPSEKEEKRRGFLRSRKQAFVLKVIRLFGNDFSGLSQQGKDRLLLRLYQDLSLISDRAM